MTKEVIEVEVKSLRDVFLGSVAIIGSGLFMWFGVRHCTGPWQQRVCVFEAGWPMYAACAGQAWGWFLLAGDKLKDFGTWLSALVRGVPRRASGTMTILPENTPKSEDK